MSSLLEGSGAELANIYWHITSLHRRFGGSGHYAAIFLGKPIQTCFDLTPRCDLRACSTSVSNSVITPFQMRHDRNERQ